MLNMKTCRLDRTGNMRFANLFEFFMLIKFTIRRGESGDPQQLGVAGFSKCSKCDQCGKSLSKYERDCLQKSCESIHYVWCL